MVWAAEELGIRHLRVEKVRLKAGEQREPGYLARNPMGVVPALRIASRSNPQIATTMTESGGIVTFLAEATSSLQPSATDIITRATYHRFCAFAIASVDPLLWNIRQHEQILPRDIAVRDIAQRARDMFANKVVPTLEAALSVSPGAWLTGADFTAADLLVGYSLFWSTVYNLLDRSPRLQNYLDSVTERPAFKRAFGDRRTVD